MPINAVFFRYFRDGSAEYLSRSWLIDPQDSGTSDGGGTGRRGQEPWNGSDFYVNHGPFDRRDWEDASKYGFISAGGRKWFVQTLGQLFVGARIFVNVPSRGYVGVGRVLEEVVPMSQFMVDLDGKRVPIAEAPMKSTGLRIESEGEDKVGEHMVRVEWIKTVPLAEAYWESGLYANQNTVTKLRNRFTLERLTKHFALDD